MTKKITATSGKVDEILSNITDVTLRQVWDNNKRINITSFVRSLALSLMKYHRDPLDNTESKLSDDQKMALNGFLNHISMCVGIFMDFLDYDDDGIVELVKREGDKYVMGDDVQLFVDNMKKISSPFKNSGETHTALIEALSSLYIYLTSKNFNESKEDVNNFKDAVKDTHESLKILKASKIDLKGLILDKIDDMIFFIIMLCIVSVAIIDKVSMKLARLEKAESEGTPIAPKDLVFSDEEIRAAVQEKYSIKLDVILNFIQRLIDFFVNSIDYKKIGRKLKKYLCCCCNKDNNQE